MELAAESASPLNNLDSIYFGGGTPSLMTAEQVSRLITKADRLFGLSSRSEITLESNPGTVDYTRLLDFRRNGINRLSLGIQSFDDRMLATLGRIHSAQGAKDAFSDARRAGFDNVGIDLIHALPGQTHTMWHNDLEQSLQLAPEHISVYGLTVEDGTRFATQYADNNLLLPDEDISAEMFEAADDLLTRYGYEHYEIANYARPGHHSQHNSGYWQGDGYLGLGAGAHSFLKDSGYGCRFSNVANLDEYAGSLGHNLIVHQDEIHLTREDSMAEYMFLGLRMSAGIAFQKFQDTFGISLKDAFKLELEPLIHQELLTESGTAIRLTRRGMLLSNQVFQKFLR